MEAEDLRKTLEMPAIEREGASAWLYNHDPLGKFSHRRDTEESSENLATQERE